jgi:hypothetical protein
MIFLSKSLPDQLSTTPFLREIIFQNKQSPFSFTEKPTSPVDITGITVLKLKANFQKTPNAKDAKIRELERESKKNESNESLAVREPSFCEIYMGWRVAFRVFRAEVVSRNAVVN